MKDVLGRKIRIGLKKKVKLEVKGDKLENKVLVGAPVFQRKYLQTKRFSLPPNCFNRWVSVQP